jgi:DNA primase catalytic subunit
MVRKLGKRSRKAIAKAKRTKGVKDKVGVPDIITKLLYVSERLKNENVTEEYMDEQIAFNKEQLRTHKYVGKHRGKGRWTKKE